MIGLDLHPEDLIDKLAQGRLTAAERERFDRHLAACPTCRFELAARDDFRESLGGQVTEPRTESLIRTGEPGVPSLPRRSGKRPLRRLGVLALAAALFTGASLAAILVRKGGPAEPSLVRATTGTASTPEGRMPARAAAEPPKAPLETRVHGAVEPPSGGPASARVPASVRTVLPKEGPAASRVNSSLAEARPDPPDSVPVMRAPSPSAADLFRSANQARRNHDDARAMALYRALQAAFPDSEEARLSRATVAKLMLDRGESKAALEGFDEYLAQGDALLGEEALVGRALALQRLGSRREEVLAWREVLRRFPQSVHARLASARLAALGKQ